jgi:hypothetical protein
VRHYRACLELVELGGVYLGYGKCIWSLGYFITYILFAQRGVLADLAVASCSLFDNSAFALKAWKWKPITLWSNLNMMPFKSLHNIKSLNCPAVKCAAQNVQGMEH